MDEQILREIAAELQEIEERHKRDICFLRKKLRMALGDVKPRPKVVEFISRDGKKEIIHDRGKP